MFFVGGQYLNNFQQPEPEVRLHVHRRSDGLILGSTLTAQDGKFVFGNLPSQGPVYIMAVKDGNRGLIFDNVIPFTEFSLLDDNTRTVNLCDPVGVVGPATGIGDITGHTIKWEQIKGQAVALSDDDTLSPTFSNTPFGISRTFRLTIDEGTCFEQVQDYEVSGRPESFSNWPINTVVRGYPDLFVSSSRVHKDNMQVLRVRIEPSVNDFPNRGPIPPDCSPINSWQLLWDKPLNLDTPEGLRQASSRFLRYEVQEFIAGQWIVVKTLQMGDTLFCDVVPGNPYRVATVWVLGPGRQRFPLAVTKTQTDLEFKLESRVVITPDTRPQDFIGANSWHRVFNTLFGQVSNFNVDIPERISKSSESISNWPINNISQAVLQVEKFNLISKGLDGSVNSEANWPSNNISLKNLQVIRSNGTSIGT